MRCQMKGGHLVLLGVSCIPLVLTLIMIPFHNSPTYEHRIVIQPPGCALVLQQGHMVLVMGDYKTHLKTTIAQARRNSPFNLLFGKDTTTAADISDDEIKPFAVAGFALFHSQGWDEVFDLWFFSLHWMEFGGPTVCFIRSPLSHVLVLFLIPPLLILGLLRLRSLLANRREAAGLCSSCGYDIRVTAEPRCLECGTKFGPIALQAFEHREAVAQAFVPREEDLVEQSQE